MVGREGNTLACKDDARVGQIPTLQSGVSEHQIDAGEPHRDRFPRHGVFRRGHEGGDGVLRQPATDDGQSADGDDHRVLGRGRLHGCRHRSSSIPIPPRRRLVHRLSTVFAHGRAAHVAAGVAVGGMVEEPHRPRVTADPLVYGARCASRGAGSIPARAVTLIVGPVAGSQPPRDRPFAGFFTPYRLFRSVFKAS